MVLFFGGPGQKPANFKYFYQLQKTGKNPIIRKNVFSAYETQNSSSYSNSGNSTRILTSYFFSGYIRYFLLIVFLPFFFVFRVSKTGKFFRPGAKAGAKGLKRQ